MLEFTPARFVPRRHLANGEVLRVTMDVSKVTQAFVLGWFAAFRSGKYSPPLTPQQVSEMCKDIFHSCWKLNQSHFLRWLELCGLVVNCAPDNGQQLVSSTNATTFLKLCAALGNTTGEEAWRHTL